MQGYCSTFTNKFKNLKIYEKFAERFLSGYCTFYDFFFIAYRGKYDNSRIYSYNDVWVKRNYENIIKSSI